MIPEENSLYRNFIQGIETLNQFLDDFQSIKEKKTVLDKFIDDYSKINTFRKILESIRKNEESLMRKNDEKNFEEIFEKAIDSEKDFEENCPKIMESIRRNQW